MSKTQKMQSKQWFAVMAETENHSEKYRKRRTFGVKWSCEKPNRKELAAIYRQEIIEDISLFTSQPAATFYREVLDALDYPMPHAKTGRTGFQKEALLRAFIVMKCEGFSQYSELADYLDNNRLVANYCGFNIMKPLPSQWTLTRFLRELDNDTLKAVTAQLARQLCELGVVDGSFSPLIAAADASSRHTRCVPSVNVMTRALSLPGRSVCGNATETAPQI